jgi:hypothetical protein
LKYLIVNSVCESQQKQIAYSSPHFFLNQQEV